MSDTITITGNIATVPEHKRTQTGVPITTFRVASSQRRFDRATGGWIDGDTNWYSVSTFRGLAEHSFVSLHKGDRILVTGRLRLREWDTGAKKGTTAEIDADAIGHDLLWGTSTFRKGDTVAPAPADPVLAEAGQPAGDAWAPPLGSGDGSAGSAERELASIDAPF